MASSATTVSAEWTRGATSGTWARESWRRGIMIHLKRAVILRGAHVFGHLGDLTLGKFEAASAVEIEFKCPAVHGASR